MRTTPFPGPAMPVRRPWRHRGTSLLVTTTLAATLPAAAILTATPAAGATTNPCTTIQDQGVGGFSWRRMPTRRVCSPTLQAGVAGQSDLVKHVVTIYYSPTATSTQEAAKATVHELTHQVEYRTTAAHRTRLYGYLGIKDATGDYFVFDDAFYYSGPLARWKQSPRERLAESVVNCVYGSPNHTGLVLVGRNRCSAFIAEFTAALAAAR